MPRPPSIGNFRQNSNNEDGNNAPDENTPKHVLKEKQ